jgi:hypothetical protein
MASFFDLRSQSVVSGITYDAETGNVDVSHFGSSRWHTHPPTVPPEPEPLILTAGMRQAMDRLAGPSLEERMIQLLQTMPGLADVFDMIRIKLLQLPSHMYAARAPIYVDGIKCVPDATEYRHHVDNNVNTWGQVDDILSQLARGHSMEARVWQSTFYSSPKRVALAPDAFSTLTEDPLSQWGVVRIQDTKPRYACCYQLLGSPGCWIAEPSRKQNRPRGYKFGHKWRPGQSADKLFASVRTFRSSMFYLDRPADEAAYQKIMTLMRQHRVAEAVAAFFVGPAADLGPIRGALFDIFALYRTINVRLRVPPDVTPSANADAAQWATFLTQAYFRARNIPRSIPQATQPAAAATPPPAASTPPPAAAATPPPAAAAAPPPAAATPPAFLAQFVAEFNTDSNVQAVRYNIVDALATHSLQDFEAQKATIRLDSYGALIRKHLQPIALEVAEYFQKAGIQDASDFLIPALNLVSTGQLNERKEELRNKAARLFHLTDWLEYWLSRSEQPNVKSLETTVDRKRKELLTIEYPWDDELDEDDPRIDAFKLNAGSQKLLHQFRTLLDYIQNGGTAFVPTVARKIQDTIARANGVWFMVAGKTYIYTRWALSNSNDQALENADAVAHNRAPVFNVKPDTNDVALADIADLVPKLNLVSDATKVVQRAANQFNAEDQLSWL